MIIWGGKVIFIGIKQYFSLLQALIKAQSRVSLLQAGPLDAAHGWREWAITQEPSEDSGRHFPKSCPGWGEEQCPHSWATQSLGKHRRGGELGPPGSSVSLWPSPSDSASAQTPFTPPDTSQCAKRHPRFWWHSHSTPKAAAQCTGLRSKLPWVFSSPPLFHSTETMLPFMSASIWQVRGFLNLFLKIPIKQQSGYEF